MSMAFVRAGTVVLLMTLWGCEPAWRSEYKDGAKLYEKETHRYFGKVVGYVKSHDFHNGTAPQAAILIEPEGGGNDSRMWGACSTCMATFDVK